MKFIHASVPFSFHLGVLLSLLLILVFILPAPVSATKASWQSQESEQISLQTVGVDIWPEYDRPSVLVIMHVKVSPQVNLPTDMSIRIPASAGKPHAVAWQSPDKALFDLRYETKTAGEWTEILFNTPSPDVQIEYYDPTLQKTSDRREFTYRWSEKYPVENLALQIQQPVNASNMSFRPDIGTGQTGDFGLTYYSLPVGKVNAGTTFDLTMSYDKPDDTLTNPQQFQPAQSNQPVNSSATGRVDQFLPWGVGALGLLLIAAGSFWYWRTGRVPTTRAESTRPRHSPARSERQVSTSAGAGESSFCQQCGNKAALGDSFCRVCGTKLR